MSSLIPLHFDRFDVRMIMRGNVPWWVLNDLCIVAGFTAPRTVAARLYDWQKDAVGVPDAIGRLQKTIVVNEAGIYGMMLGSNKPDAERFARWLFTEVIPSIRKFGKYPPDPEPEVIAALPAPIDIEASRPARFLQECERIAAEHGEPMNQVFEHIVSKDKIKALRMAGDNLTDLLSRKAIWAGMIGLDMDMKYVLFGERSLRLPEFGPPASQNPDRQTPPPEAPANHSPRASGPEWA